VVLDRGDIMNIIEIKRKANQIYNQYRSQIIPEFFYVGYINLLAQYLRSGLFSFIVSLFLCPISHGYVKCSMKLVDEENVRLDYHDSMIGIIEFPRVASVYLIRKVIMLSVTFVCALPSLFLLMNQMPELSDEIFASLGNAIVQTEFYIPHFHLMLSVFDNLFLMTNIFICIFVYLFLTALFLFVPYIMEQEDFSWSESLIYSYRLMKKNKVAYFQLYFVYASRYFIYWFLTGFILMIFGSINEILMLFCMVSSLFLYIDILKGRFEIAKYLFYKEVRGEKDEKYQNSEKDNY